MSFRFRRWVPRPTRLRVEVFEARDNPAAGWRGVTDIPTSPTGTAYLHPDRFQSVLMDLDVVELTLAAAPSEEAAAAGAALLAFDIPGPDGRPQRFAVVDAPVMAPGLAAAFPDVRTYRGYGLDDPTATVRLDVTPAGFHAQVLSAGGAWYVDPYYHLEDDVHISYYRRDLGRDDVFAVRPGETHEAARAAAAVDPDGRHTDGWSCTCVDCTGAADAMTLAVDGKAGAAGRPVAAFDLPGWPTVIQAPARGPAAGRSGTQLRTYRAAVAATGEYTQFHGGTVAAGQAAIVTAMNRVNQIYENELSIRMTLVANNQNLVYTSGSTDPYTNGNGGAMLGQNQSNVNAVIGNANYDIGHVFSTGGGGIASLGSVGINAFKAEGVTGQSAPIGDPFTVDYVAHEMGHQWGGNHTFNTTTSGGQRNASTAYEPGSGSTIQAYAGITGSNSDLQPNSDPYFSFISLVEILNHADNVIPNVGTRAATGNTVPTVSAGADFAIPTGTPFVLTASGSDANGDTLTYSWEQMDLGAAQLLNAADNGASPLFRARVPTTSPSRTFPRLSDLVNNTNTIPLGEKLPTAARASMDFRVVARDSRSGGGGINWDDMVVNVVNTGAAFAVTGPNTAVSWAGNSSQTVTWNVAGTTAAPISAANVAITLSTDGGFTYPITLAAGTPNDGSETITVPNTVTTTQARVRVQPVNNIFFDISNANFSIAPAAGVTVSRTGGLFTSEAGGLATFTVVLAAAPTANVTIGLSSSDLTEGTVSPPTLVFTPSNWSTPQTVTATGVDDGFIDGNVLYTVVTAAAASTDSRYSGLAVADVGVVNLDDDRGGITDDYRVGSTRPPKGR